MPRLSLLAALLLILPGCHHATDPNAALAKANATNIQRLANLYLAYQSEHDWHGPPDEARFKAFLHTFNPAKLQRIGIDPQAIDALFVSQRDQQPFKIRYNVRGSAMGSAEPVIFESTGKDGRYEVAFLNMTHREVDREEYDALWSGKQKPTGMLRTN